MRRLLLCLALTGCVDTNTRYPTLLPRAIEKTSLDEPVLPPAPPVAADPALDARIAELERQGVEALKAFATAAQEAETKVALAKGATEGSDVWLNAQLSLAGLDVARQPFASQQSELEQMAVDRATSGQPPYPALERAIANARACTEQVRDRSTALEASLAR